MIVKAVEMVEAVKVAIDENRGNRPLLLEEDTDTLSLDEIIYAKLADAVRVVETEAPRHLLEAGHDMIEDNDKDFFIDGDGKGFVVLPDDFMRMISFRMSDWRRTVYEPISEEDPKYALQSSKWKGICGDPEKPVVAIVNRSEGMVLEFYSCNDAEAFVTQATYIPIPKIDRDGGIDVSEKCYRATVYRAASFALASIGDPLSSTMLEISRSLLQ